MTYEITLSGLTVRHGGTTAVGRPVLHPGRGKDPRADRPQRLG